MSRAHTRAQPQRCGVAKRTEIIQMTTNSRETMTAVNQTHFSVLFHDTSVAATNQSMPALKEQELQDEQSTQKYVRNVFIILSISMATAIGSVCGLQFTNLKEFVCPHLAFVIALGVSFLVLPVVAFIIRAWAGDNTKKTVRWIFMFVFHLVFALLMAGLSCLDPTEFASLTFLGLMCFTFILIAAFGSRCIHSSCGGIVFVFMIHFVSGVILIPTFWSFFGAENGKWMIGTCFAALFLCSFAIYDIMRLCGHGRPKHENPEENDFVWDSVHMFLELFFLIVIISLCIATVAIIVIICFLILEKDD